MVNEEDLGKNLLSTRPARENDIPKEKGESSLATGEVKQGNSSQPGTHSQFENHSARTRFSSQAYEVAQQLEEPNIGSIQRLIEIFGAEFIVGKAEEASVLYTEAAARGEAAYQQPNTPVATGKSKARTLGGVFFFLLREHCLKLGLDWNGLRIAPPAWYERKPKKQSTSAQGTKPEPNPQIALPDNSTALSVNPVQNLTDPETPPLLSQATSKVTKPAAVSVSASNPKLDTVVSLTNKGNSSKSEGEGLGRKGAGVAEPNSKPTRLKATVIGTLLGNPKFNPNGKEGLVELRFNAQMNGSSLPKGLPDLGESKVVVWCTKKQLDKILQQTELTPQTRFIVEGEPVPAVSSDLTPFLRLICTRLTTVELEQARHNA